MKEMKIGDLCFFYHSNAKPTGIVGIVQVVREAYPDHTAWEDPKLQDSTSSREHPKWFMVDVKLIRRLHSLIPLSLMKKHKDKELKDMTLLVNSRLSVQPVSDAHWSFILEMEECIKQETK